MHLERELLGVEDDGRDAGRALLGAQESRRLLAHARRLALEPERVEVLPACLGARAAVRARIAPDLEGAVAGGERVDPAAALDELLLDRGALGRDEEAPFALRPHRRSGDVDIFVAHPGLCAEAQVDFVGDRVARRVRPPRRVSEPPHYPERLRRDQSNAYR